MPFILRFTPLPRDGIGQYFPHHADAYYFVRLGEQWPHNPARRFIDETTPTKENARMFATEGEANEILAVAGSPGRWEVIELKEPTP